MTSVVDTPTMTYVRSADGTGFVCPHCGIVKRRQNTMFYHMKKHLGEARYVCPVAGCGRAFIQKSGLTQHTAQCHPVADTPLWSCPCEDCGHTARMKSNMTVHIARIHGGGVIPPAESSGPTACARCDRLFSSGTAYYYHAGKCWGLELAPVAVAGPGASKTLDTESE
jgi:uncharacterized C2H2 Zn-finger protein